MEYGKGHCLLELVVPKVFGWNNIEDIRDASKEDTEFSDITEIWFEETNEDVKNIYCEVNIKGKDHDGRCEWCRKFRSNLLIATEDKENIDFVQEKFCKFGLTDYQLKKQE